MPITKNTRPRERIAIPRGGARYRKMTKLREEGILRPDQTIEEYNQEIDAGVTSLGESEENQEPTPNNAESLEIEGQRVDSESGFGNMLKRAGRNLRDTLTDSDVPVKRGRKPNQTTREDFSLLVVSIITLVVTFWKVDQRVKPDSSEIEAFSNHLSGILIRHLPISNKLSADALDIIGMFAVLSGYYARIQLLQQDQKPAGTIEAKSGNNGHIPQTPLQELDPATFDAMNRVARSYNTRG